MPSSILLLVCAAGALLALQAPANAAMGRALGSGTAAALLSFLVGSMVMTMIVIAGPQRANFAAIKEAPPFAWTGGAIGALVVLVAAYAVPRIGAAALLAALMVGQLTTAVSMDHFGWAGLAPRPLDIQRVAGLALVVVGVLIVRHD